MKTFQIVVSSCIALALLACGSSEAPSVTSISQEAFVADSPSEALILDVRTSAEYESGHVPAAVNIPHDQLELRLAELDSEKDRPIVVYCESGRRAGKASTTLVEAGYTKILHLEGDMSAWREKGRPTETGS